MTSSHNRVVTGWNRFWFAPRSTAPVEVFRIGFGVLATLWMLSMAPAIEPFFASRAAVPASADLRPGAWTLFTLAGGSATATAWTLWLVGLVAAAALTVGWCTRLAAVAVFVVMISFTRQALFVFNSGDGLVRILAFYMIFMPAGSAISVDRRRSDRENAWTFPRRAPWALRLAQIQLSVIYLSTFWEKTASGMWRDGTALSYALRLGDLQRLPLPSFLTDRLWASELLTFGTLGLELALGVLVWNRAVRPWVLGMGVLLHVSIDLTLAVGFFSLAMLTLYLTFLSPEAAERLVAVVRGKVERRHAPVRSAPARDAAMPALQTTECAAPDESLPPQRIDGTTSEEREAADLTVTAKQ